uniref:RING-type domain-containing protein n=1 Tax=Lotharella globosa TaxID=91324 RepID=A0A7S3YEZ9_9EUKA|mmetsp:Transcript_13032/g.26575  ORF Transcript_13032/g.26575 Transcript_13032/m.26575 type:complete len:159 (-) Transcript_13032:370-846(-)
MKGLEAGFPRSLDSQRQPVWMVLFTAGSLLLASRTWQASRRIYKAFSQPNVEAQDHQRKKKCRKGQMINKDCPICLETLQPNMPNCVVLRCSHGFHRPCLDRWLEKRRICPYCRCSSLDGYDGTGTVQSEVMGIIVGFSSWIIIAVTAHSILDLFMGM